MSKLRRVAVIAASVGALLGCSASKTAEQGVTYTVTNRCGDDLTIELVGSGDQVSVRDGESRSVPTLDQEPDAGFIVTGPAGTEAVHVRAGTSTVAIEDDRCPTEK